ncbi:MAG: tetratricopeptide repeat protein [bacterium]|nr:tetratricopeptide repeat protein [bacterium]
MTTLLDRLAPRALGALLASALPVWLLGTCPLLALQDDDGLDAQLLGRVEATVRAGAGDTSGELYRACVTTHGDVDRMLDALEERVDDEELGAGERAGAKRLLADVLHRHGDLDQALDLVAELAAETTDQGLLLQHARLLDAQGRIEQAIEAYERLLAVQPAADIEGFVRLRLAMMTMSRDAEHEDALAAFAVGTVDEALRNRAAVVLAVSERPQDAIELFVASGTETQRFRQEARLAQWAIDADASDVAQEHAWIALEVAKLRRDRNYALTLLVEAHRKDETLDALIARFAEAPELAAEARGVWIDLLRETGRVEEAVEMFRGAREAQFTIAERRELLEMYREAGQEDVMLGVYRDLIVEQPDILEWREGLSRFLLERGARDEAREVWASFESAAKGEALLWGAEALAQLGLDDEARACAERFLADGGDSGAPLMFLFGLFKERGDLAAAEEQLERLDELAPPEAAARMQLAEAYEQLGKLDRAVAILEAVRAARPEGETGEDLEMRLAWLFSEVGEEKKAMEAWLTLWRRINSIPRRRYVEDRLMAVASRLGTLADVAIELEEKLAAGTANERESGLLVRLYTKVGDPVSAAEVIEEFMKHSGGSVVDALQEKARVYIACTDFHNYERTVHELIAADPEGRPEYLRQLAMSMLERGKPDEAREVLGEIAELEGGEDRAEFEAGVLALAGLREEAIGAYRRGVAANPGRIDSYLLMANLMKETGQQARAVGMFQFLAETAEKDDQFTIAIDGLLNMEANPDVLRWARRITLERLARRHDKMYLYQLLSDLSEELDERDQMIVALENSLSISGERRPAVLRELMDLAKGSGGNAFGGVRGWKGDKDKHLAYGRRLIGLGDIVPPQVYLDLGEAFLEADAVADATKTFRLAHELPDYDVFQRQAAGLLEKAGYLEAALRIFERVLVTQPSDVSLLAKVGELQEQMGRDDVARELYARAVELLLVRRPLSTSKAEEKESGDPFAFFAARNVDDFDQYYTRVLEGLLVTTPADESLDERLAAQRASIEADLALVLAEREERAREASGDDEEDDVAALRHYPRLLRRTELLRRLAIAYGRPDAADAVDATLLAAFPEDDALLEELSRARLDWGLVASARGLIENSGRSDDAKREALFNVGQGSGTGGGRPIPMAEATRQFLPLLAEGRGQDASALLLRTDFAGVEKEALDTVQGVFSAALYLDDKDLLLRIGREWIRLHVKHESYEHQLEPVIERCKVVLDTDRQRSLCEYFVGLVLEDAERASKYIRMLPRLQDAFDEPIVTEEQVMELLDGYGERYAYGLGPVLRLLPAPARAGALRGIWPKIQNTGRATFLIQLVAEFKEPLGEELGEFIADSFTESLDEADDFIKYYIDDLAGAEENVDVVLRMTRGLMEKRPADMTVTSLLARSLLKTGETEEAVELASEALMGLLGKKGDYYENRARDGIFEEFLPDHLDAFTAALDADAADKGDSVEIAKKRIDLLESQEDEEATLAAIASAVESFPEDQDLLERLERQYKRAGRTLDALETLARLVELDPDDTKKRKRLYEGWLARKDPVRALEVRKSGSIEPDESNPNANLPPGVIVMVQGGTVMTSGAPTGATKKKGAWPEGKTRPASMERVKETLEAGEEEESRTTLRRVWRKYPDNSNRGRIIYFGNYNPSANLKWPEAKDEDDEELKRGGFDDYEEEEPEDEEPKLSAWEVLAAHGFGAAEMDRYVRTVRPGQLDSMQPVFEGILRARTLADGDEVVLDELLETVRAGSAGKIEYVLLLALLDEHPERITPDVRTLLGDLVRTLNPVDAGQLRRVARAYARTGGNEEATRLYRWCATQTQSPSRFWGSSGTVSANALVKEVKETLEGDDRLAVIEAILTFADPGADTWSREGYEVLAIETWLELAGPAEALARCEAICDATTDFSSGLRRRTALRAAHLFARAGETERALACFEVGLCKLDPALFTSDDPYRFIYPERPGSIGHADLRRLFPKDFTEWPNAAEWFRAAARALEEWIVAERVRESNATMALALLARRIFEAGDAEESARLIGVLEGLDGLSPSRQLWIADATRAVGLSDRAEAIERRLLQERRLRFARVPEVVARVLEAEGPDAALALGDSALAATRIEALTEVLLRAARAKGDAEGIARWEGEIASRVAAQAELEALDADEEGEG